MDFKTLLEPYAEPNEHGVPKRTVEGQIKWLTKRHGLPQDVVDKTILKVYNELESGLVFESDESGSSGHKLDRYLYETAKNMVDQSVKKQAKDLEEFMSKFKQQAVEKYVASQQGSVWKRIKAVFKPV
jgi:NH3-dependent NAD+ synthetase